MRIEQRPVMGYSVGKFDFRTETEAKFFKEMVRQLLKKQYYIIEYNPNEYGQYKEKAIFVIDHSSHELPLHSYLHAYYGGKFYIKTKERDSIPCWRVTTKKSFNSNATADTLEKFLKTKKVNKYLGGLPKELDVFVIGNDGECKYGTSYSDYKGLRGLMQYLQSRHYKG